MPKRLGIIGAIVLAAIVYVTYQSSFRMGLYLDDYYIIERAGRMDLADAPRQIFDPRAQSLWYRPLQGVQFFIAYRLFGANGNAYHLVNMTFHVINVLLVYAIARRMSQNWLICFASAFFYATFSVYMSAVDWAAIVEPLLGVFYLASFWFWWNFLETEDRRYYWFALSASVLACMAKQTALTIPIVFFLADRLLVAKPVSFVGLIRRYAPFVAVVVVFAFLQFSAPSTYTFTGWFGWKVGPTMLAILWEYLVLFFFPWGSYPAIDLNLPQVGNTFTYLWAAAALVFVALATWFKRSRVLVFLGIFTFVTLAPILPFPFLEHRYLYLPIIPAGVILGLLFKYAHDRWSKQRGFVFAASLGLVLLAFGNGLAVNDSVIAASDWTRALRVPFRDIERDNPTFPQDTLLYFVDPIVPTEGNLSALFFLRYGKEITVLDWSKRADLRAHNVAYVYYFGDDQRARRIEVEKNVATRATPEPPLRFDAPIRWEGYEITRTTIQRGTPLVVILYWRTLGEIGRDYTMFFHLVDPNGKMIAGYDGQPLNGKLPTHKWEANKWFADAVMIPIDADAPPGKDYKLEFGFYFQPTGERLGIVDGQGNPIGDAIVIESFAVTE